MSPDQTVIATRLESIEAAAIVIDGLQEKIAKLEADLEYSNEKVRLFQRQIFLSSQSEKKPKDEIPEQEHLFNEAEGSARFEPGEEQDTLISVPAHTRARGKPKRRPLPPELPRKEINVPLPDSELICSHDDEKLVEIGEEISEQIDIIPAHIQVLRYHKKKYGCPKCDRTIKTAPPLPQPIPRSLASPGLLSFIAVSKYADGLPLYRQEAMLARYGIDIPRQTMAAWMIRCGELVTPLINLMKEQLVESDYLNGDETKVQVLKEDGRRAEALSWMWVLARAGPKPLVVFTYEKTRSGSVPKKLLSGFKGHLQVDGYGGYNEVARDPDVVRLGCGMHIRRKFHDAQAVAKHGQVGNRGLAFMKKLYKAEGECREFTSDERKKYRDEHARPVLAEFKAWIDSAMHKVPPKSASGKALLYAYREWEHFIRYLDDGRFEIDNGFAENQIRPFAVGRKNWLFSDTEKGAEASANLYSLSISARLNGLNSYDYLKAVFTRLPLAKTLDDIEALLPTRWKPAAPN